ncbi:MAG: YcjX family protein [Rheinheimera sp.]|nr:YcjX family protein [Rheinheimera sp.]
MDRQVVLVDCLGALNQGYAVMQETQQALMQILQSFSYGPSSFLRGYFSRKLTKFCLKDATKADLLTPEQHRNLILLLQQMLQQPLQDSRYQRAKTKAFSSFPQ